MKVYTIKKTSGISFKQLERDLANGGRFVIYGYCVSIIARTFRLTSSPYFIQANESSSKYRGTYTAISLIFGWWGLPWGPVFTVDMIKINKKNGGGIDITDELLPKLKLKFADKDANEIFAEDVIVEFDENEMTGKGVGVGNGVGLANQVENL